MTFAQPWALALAALAAPLIAMYFYKIHRDRRRVASTILLRAIRDERPTARRARAHLRHRLSLALTLLALLLAIVALVGPRTSAGRASRTVIVLDRSASMATRDDGGTRLAAAVDAVSRVAARAGNGDELALLAAGGEPGVIVAPTRAHVEVEAAAAAIAERGGFGDNRDDAVVFRLAEGLCRDPDRMHIVVISDGVGLGLPPSRCPIETVALGRAAHNLGIAGLSVRSLDGLGTYDVHIAVASSYDDTRKVDVTLALSGAVVDVVRLEVAPNGDAERTVRVTLDAAAGGTLSATLMPVAGDALALDDRAEVALGGTGPVSVLLVTDRRGSLVAEALRLHPRVDLAIAAPTHLPTTKHDLIVLESRPAMPLPPARHVVALGVELPGSPLVLADTPASRTITRWDFDAPWFRYVDLRDVQIGKARRVEGGRSVVDSDRGPLAATTLWDERELLVTGFAIDETDLTLRAAFPNVIANLVDWAAPTTVQQPARGVLAAAESHVKPHALPTATSATTTHDGPWFARLAVLLALLLLCVEQAFHARRFA